MNIDIKKMSELEKLIDLDQKILITDEDVELYFNCFELMVVIRETERKLAEKRKSGVICGPVHLAAGQEAISVGVSKNLRKSDHVFSAHRSHAHLLALDSNPRKLFSEILGRKTGFSNGHGGSMHLFSGSNGFQGSVPIVAGTVPLAVGAGLASKLKGDGAIGVAYFGDGAMEEGVVHESLNAASILRLPVLFVCENNLFSSHLHISERQPSWLNSRFAYANLVKAEIVDGNNIKAVLDKAQILIDFIRKTGRPAFLEAFTYRHYGHVDWREDIDVGVGRSNEDLQLWRGRDPILRLKTTLGEKDNFERINMIVERVQENVENAWSLAEKDPPLNPDQLLNHVFSKVTSQNVK